MSRLLGLPILLAIILFTLKVHAQRTYDTLNLGSGINLELVLIPSGTFYMGSPNSDYYKIWETPMHQVTISKPFWMGVYEVTQEQYEAVQVHGHEYLFPGPKNPVERLDWTRVQDFCSRLSMTTGRTVRMPTEAEWEFACRAGTRTRFFFGNEINNLDLYAWGANSGGTTHPVGQLLPNPWGLYDICGNVWEYCSDYFSETYYQNLSSPVIDPQGPVTKDWHGQALKGGAWRMGGDWCRSAARAYDLNLSGGDHGMRVVLEYDSNSMVDKKARLKGGEAAIRCSPNPFNPRITITLSHQQAAINPVLEIYDGNGRLMEIVNAESPANAVYVWNAADHPSGIYIARVSVGGRVLSARLLLVK
ncbi:MAG: hypothetical protein A2487_02350 [Candidatus Raymondbacteria bacterium RifOxyC12_full_50_8]|nr:MAG: hypothetical protein A2487_02350 [Candidatus Raymondbacteria bacterium RifOxyC12_full_50_8]